MYFKDEFGLDIINIDVANKAQNVIIYIDQNLNALFVVIDPKTKIQKRMDQLLNLLRFSLSVYFSSKCLVLKNNYKFKFINT